MNEYINISLEIPGIEPEAFRNMYSKRATTSLYPFYYSNVSITFLCKGDLMEL